MIQVDINKINEALNTSSPEEIVAWALSQANTPIVTTNFRPYEAAILHLCGQQRPDIPVIWCDTGYNTKATYLHAERLIEQLSLTIDLFVPQKTAAHRDAVMGIPAVDDPGHAEFTEQVKLEPFRRAMAKHQPDLWFTNLRKGQTAFRDSLEIVSRGADGVLKVSPFYHWPDDKLDLYLERYNLENEFRYFDPTKALDNRECGLHITELK